MATHDSGTLPQYYGPQLQDGTIMESPAPPLRSHAQESSDSRQELLRLPAPAHIDQDTSNVSPPAGPDDANALGLVNRSSSRRMGSHANFHDYGSPSGNRSSRTTPSQLQNQALVRRNPYVEEYFSDDDEYEPPPPPQPYRRRPSRHHHRPPPSAYENDSSRAMSRYYTTAPMMRRSLEPYHSYHKNNNYNDKPSVHLHYGSDDEYAPPRRPPLRPGVAGNQSGGPARRPPSTEDVMRLPWAIWMGSNAKNHFVAFIGEFVGTTMFLFFAFSGTQVANIGSGASASNTTTGEATGFSPNVLLYIALVFSFSLMVNVWVFFRISGGLFNPAVTFAFLLCRAMSLTRASLLIAAQTAGSILASYLVSVLFPTPFNVRTTLSKGTSLAQGVFIEAILTAELVFTIFMLAKEKHKATFIAPVGIGLALFIAELVGVYYTGGSLNPARSFGPCVVTGIFDKEHWIYWVGPAVGTILAVIFYKFIKILEYEVANPGQDDDDKDAEIKEKIEHGPESPDRREVV
ncbi:hypothetical protein ACEQ8H_002395 [Pleosporales sp. CAS-2024a]